MLEGLGGIAGAIVGGNKIIGATKNVVKTGKNIQKGFKKYNMKKNPQPTKRFKRKATTPAKPNI